MKVSKAQIHAAGRAGKVALLAAVLAFGGTGTALAQTCLEDVAGDLNCTANDFAISSITVTNLDANDCGGPSNSFTFDGQINVESGSTSRYDVGFYISTDSNQALTGQCSVHIIAPGGSADDDGDQCGDYDGSAIGVNVSNVTVQCNDTDGDGFFDIALCTAYDNNAGANCQDAGDALPGTASKCDCTTVNTDVEIPHCDTNADCTEDDNNVCTSNVCLGLGEPGADEFGCGNANNTLPCDDGLFCNGADTCGGGTCNHAGNPCAGGGICGDNCNEGDDNCFDPAGTVCRAAAGVCDTQETCTGSSASCPADQFLTSECRAANGVCDVAESCSGSSASCPADGFAGTGVQCRADAGECDVAENCSGSSASCPADAFESNGTGCTPDSNVCTDDVCDGSGSCTHPNNTASCNDGLFCTVSDVCSGGTCGGSPRDCSDPIGCTDDTCDEGNDTCVSTENNANCDDQDACTEDVCSIDADGCVNNYICVDDICRSAGYWSTHSGYEKLSSKTGSTNIGQLLLDIVGPLEVCGQSIDATANAQAPYLDGLGLSSALEGLCKRTQGVQQRSLYRQLVAAALNCAASGSQSCDFTTGKYIDVSYDDCDALCAGNPVENGPSIGECTSQLDCFNNGGHLVNGDCALGTCADQPEINCGADYGPCPDFNALPQECVRFEGNCHSTALCNEPLGFCPKASKASSPGACREARFNTCTIDSCN